MGRTSTVATPELCQLSSCCWSIYISNSSPQSIPQDPPAAEQGIKNHCCSKSISQDLTTAPCTMNKSPVCIGISGATRSGKSTLAKTLRLALGEESSVVLAQDRHFNLRRIQANGGNWEASSSLDHEAFYQEVIAARTTAGIQYVICEGFRSFFDERLLQLMHVTIWLDIDEAVCEERRQRTKRVPPGYFAEFIWPSHLEYEAKVMAQQPGNLLRIDGTLGKGDIESTALRHIMATAGAL